MIIVGVHLSHGAKSMFQSLGINHPHYNSFIEKFPPLLGWIVAVAGVAIPVAILTGMVQ
jgi:succinate dehydrogenase / fumarate reductase cytochrome b subunit